MNVYRDLAEVQDWAIKLHEYDAAAVCLEARQKLREFEYSERRMMGDLDVLTDKNEKLVEENHHLRAIVEKLPKTTDGVSVVPNVDPIFIDPESSGWMGGERPIIGSYDEDDRYVPEPVWEITTWAWWGDHLTISVDAWHEFEGWDGKYYSTREAGEAAAKA